MKSAGFVSNEDDRRMSRPGISRGPGHRVSLAALAAIVLGAAAVRAQTAAEVAEANNPLAPITGINLQNYYVPTIYGSPDSTSNTFLLRPIIATESMLVRMTLPLPTISGGGVEKSGIGDMTVFDAFLLPPKGNTEFGAGPLFVFPTASNEALGAGKWQAGAAVVVVSKPTPSLLLSALVTYQHSFANAGSTERATTSVLTAQPIVIAQVGGGWYLRSTGVWNFDIAQGNWSIPIGVGVGKVVKEGSALLNFFLEPQFTVVHYGPNQPAVQIFAGINLQFPKKSS